MQSQKKRRLKRLLLKRPPQKQKTPQVRLRLNLLFLPQRHLRLQLRNQQLSPQHLLHRQRQQLRQQRHRPHRLLQLLQHLEFLVQVTTHSRLHREWEFHVRCRVRETILFHHLKEWVALVHLVQVVHVRLVPVVQAAQVAQVAQVVRLVPVVQAVRVDSLVHRVQVLAAALQVELREPVALVVRAVAQVAVAVAA